MQRTLPVQLKRISKDKIKVEITRDNFEMFCNAVGIFKKEFLSTLRKSDADHRAGRVTKRTSLLEIVEKP